MRSIRALTVAAVVMAALPTIAHAQGGRGFKDSWFWGLKGGGYSLADSGHQLRLRGRIGQKMVDSCYETSKARNSAG